MPIVQNVRDGKKNLKAKILSMSNCYVRWDIAVKACALVDVMGKRRVYYFLEYEHKLSSSTKVFAII